MPETKKRQDKKHEVGQLRFGIAEWYGKPFASLGVAERRRFAAIQNLPKAQKPSLVCPFQSTDDRQVNCNKPGGYCSFRLYEKMRQTGEVKLAAGESGQIRTFCPKRFEEEGMIYGWVGETLLNCATPVVLKEIGFLGPPPSESHAEESGKESVGRIDKVLVVPGAKPLSWCPLEVQAVYFSGRAMKDEFAAILHHPGDTLPFPVHIRRPDYRSSAPKRTGVLLQREESHSSSTSTVVKSPTAPCQSQFEQRAAEPLFHSVSPPESSVPST